MSRRRAFAAATVDERTRVLDERESVRCECFQHPVPSGGFVRLFGEGGAFGRVLSQQPVRVVAAPPQQRLLRDPRRVLAADWRLYGFLARAQGDREVPEVIEIQTFLGRVDVRLSVIARDMPHYQQVYRDKLLTLPHIADIEALMHVARVKFDETLPL